MELENQITNERVTLLLCFSPVYPGKQVPAGLINPSTHLYLYLTSRKGTEDAVNCTFEIVRFDTLYLHTTVEMVRSWKLEFTIYITDECLTSRLKRLE